MTVAAQKELLHGATRYIWWEEPAEAIRRPSRIIAQVMNIGDFEDVQRMFKVLGEASFKQALETAEPGWFNEKSWGYWHYRLRIAAPGDPMPPMPQRGYP